ncbi:MAG: hypothetical protein IJC17_00200 [Clostridia bacterium]|nr:hypothetical protein [Clostridia bacterium]
MKKVFAILLAVLMLSTLCLPAFAASDINADEQRILDLLEEIATGHHGADMELHAVDVNQAKAFFMKNEIDIPEEDADAIIAEVEKAFDLVVKSGLKEEDLGKLDAEDKEELLAIANEAGSYVNVTVSYDAAEHETHFVYTDDETGETTVVGTTSNIIKVTGADYTMLFVVLSAAVLAVAALAVVVKKTACAK